jgi:hypothetical protein
VSEKNQLNKKRHREDTDGYSVKVRENMIRKIKPTIKLQNIILAICLKITGKRYL